MPLKQYLEKLLSPYNPIEHQSEGYVSLRNESSSENTETNHRCHHGRFAKEILLVAFLSTSVLLNLVLLNTPTFLRSPLLSSQYADLDKTIDLKITRNNWSLEDDSWNDKRYDGYLGVVALHDSFVQEHKLLQSQPYPWDPSKKLYFLQGYHSMHCIKLVRTAILETYQGHPWSESFGHIKHCLNVLKEDIACYADDFPRYTGPFNDQIGQGNSSASGLGSIRQCRDWNQLSKFARDNSACFKPVSPTPTTLEQYKFCPDGSKPWEKFGL